VYFLPSWTNSSAASRKSRGMPWRVAAMDDSR
jgi:hypothetical protein